MITADPIATRSDQARRLRTAIRLLVRRFALSERADVACCGMTVAQAATLDVLGREGPTKLGALGRTLGIRASTLSRNVARLEERGLVRRVPDPADARSQRAELTESGRRAALEVERQEEAFAVTILERLSAGDRTDVLSALEALLVAVREATERCCPGAYDHLMNEIDPRISRVERRTS